MEKKEKYKEPKIQMDEYICCNGSFQQVVDNIVNSGLLPKELAVESLNYLMENLDILDEKMEVLSAEPSKNSDHFEGTGFMLGDANFYIKLRKSTIMIALMLVSSAAISFIGADEVSLFASFMIGALGDVSHLGFKLYEESGEKCVIRELASKRPSVMTPKEMKRNIGKVCTKNYNCKFKKNGKCKCERNDIIDICENLKEKGAVVKSGSCYGYLV